MMRPAMSGTRFSSRNTLKCTSRSSKKGDEDSRATTMAKTGTRASSVVKARLPAICGHLSSFQRRSTKSRNAGMSARKRTAARYHAAHDDGVARGRGLAHGAHLPLCRLGAVARAAQARRLLAGAEGPSAARAAHGRAARAALHVPVEHAADLALR